MSTSRATVSIKVDILQASASPLGGGGQWGVNHDFVYGPGSGASQFEVGVRISSSIGAASFSTLDIVDNEIDLLNNGLAGPFPPSLRNVRAIVIEWPETADGILEVSPSSSTPWRAFLKDATDVLKLEPGAVFVIARKGVGYAIDASAQSIDLTNTGSVAADAVVTLIGQIT